MDQKVGVEKDADKKFKKGKEALTTGVFQWKKDYNLGAMHFEDAAKLYKECKNAIKEKEALKLAIECNEQLNDSWAVGRNYEALLNSLIDNSSTDFNELLQWTQKACMYFKVADSGMKSLQVYIKVSKYLIKCQKFDFAEQLIVEGMKEAEEQNAPSTRTDIIILYVEINVETKQYSKVAELYTKEIQKYREEHMKYPLAQYALVIVIMYILQDEIMRANSELEQLIIQVYNFHKSSEFRAADQMLNSYEKGDQAQFNDAIMKSCVTSLYPPNIFRALRKVKVRVISLHNKQNLQQQSDEQVQSENNYQQELEKKIL